MSFLLLKKGRRCGARAPLPNYPFWKGLGMQCRTSHHTLIWNLYDLVCVAREDSAHLMILISALKIRLKNLG